MHVRLIGKRPVVVILETKCDFKPTYVYSVIQFVAQGLAHADCKRNETVICKWIMLHIHEAIFTNMDKLSSMDK